MNAFLKLCRSIRFNIYLFMGIAVLSAVGTLIPQVTDSAEKVAAFKTSNQLWGSLFESWGFFDVYHTWLFALLLGWMAINVVVCKLSNRPPDPGLVPLPMEESEKTVITQKAIESKPYIWKGTLTEPVDKTVAGLEKKLRQAHYGVRVTHISKDRVALVASRFRIQRWGSYLSHISIVIVLIGGFLKSLLGFETFLPILEGRSSGVVTDMIEKLEEPLPRVSNPVLGGLQQIWQAPTQIHRTLQKRVLAPLSDWTLSVEKMTVDFYPNSASPSTFASKIRLLDGHTPLADTTIRVNQPLDVRRVRFYQASWGVTGMVTQALVRVNDKIIPLGMGGRFPIPGQPWTARLEHYLPDFTVGADNRPTTASLEWKNPAVIFGFYNKQEKKLATVAIGAPSPAMPKDSEPWAMFFMGDSHMSVRPPFDVIDVKPAIFSGVQVSYDPGFPVIVAGVLFMLTGLCILFYLHQRRISILIHKNPRGKEVHISVGAWSSRGGQDFAPEFRSVTRMIQQWAQEAP